jgi:hypothetical protein
MEAKEKVYRRPLGVLVLILLGALFAFYIAFSVDEANYFFFFLASLVLISALLHVTSTVKISEHEITVSKLTGSKSLKWAEIAHISTHGQTLRLHHRDNDLVLSIDPQLVGYTTIVDIVFSKRADLIDESETTFSTTWLTGLVILAFGSLITIFSVFAFLEVKGVEKFFAVLLLAAGIYTILLWFLYPRRVVLENQNIRVKYLFRELSYTVDHISSITLEKLTTKDGYSYFVQINLSSGKKIKLPPFKQGFVVAYQVIKRWHIRASSSVNRTPAPQTSSVDEIFSR